MDQPPPTTPSPQPEPDDDVWLTTAQAAELTGRHRESIRRYIRDGVLHARPKHGSGRELEVLRSELLGLIESRSHGRPERVALRAERSQVMLSGDRVSLEP